MYDALLLVSFGGPESPDDVLPFLENVTRGRGVPRERLLEVAEHYSHFGGRSPINDQCRELLAALAPALDKANLPLRLYWGNRNWHPFLSDALRQMQRDGIKTALAFVTSAYSSYSGCRQYCENIAAAQAEVGQNAPRIDKLRVFYNHPAFVAASADRVREALERFPPNVRDTVHLVFTAHSIPCSMARTSDYEKQLRETAGLVSGAIGLSSWELAFQSRSGPPSQPWLEPDILDRLRHLKAGGTKQVLIAPVGFVSDHLEVLYDLDTEAAALAAELGLEMHRAGTVGTHPNFVEMICDLVAERVRNEPALAVGNFGPNHDLCPADCCPAPARPVPKAADTPLVSVAPAVSQRS